MSSDLTLSSVRNPHVIQPLVLIDLPTDVLQGLIFSQLDMSSKRVCRSLCRRFRQLIPFDGYSPEGFLLQAAQCGHLKVVEWAYANFCSRRHPNENMFSACMRYLGVIKNPFTQLPYDIRMFAAYSGKLEVLQWAHANGAPMDDGVVCIIAARKGCLDILQWAHKNGAPWNENVCRAAAEEGRLDILQWLHANGAPWDASVCEAAARGGYLKVLQWLRAKGAPWDVNVYINASRGGYLEVLEWAEANGAPIP